MSHTREIQAWKNSDLIDYFEKVPLEVFRDYAVRGGIEEGCDIDIAYPFIEKTQSLIEIGACYGRVLRHLLRKGYSGKVFAIERSKHLYGILEENYINRVKLINADIQSFQAPEPVDAILWMWSDISGFPQADQLPILERLSSWLNPKGMLILETIEHTLAPKNATYVNGQSYIIKSEYGTLYGYIPSEAEVHIYAKKLGFQDIQHLHYHTPTGRERIVHIFRNRAQSKDFIL